MSRQLPSQPLQVMARHRMQQHSAFTRVSSKLLNHEAPCMSDADDWETSSAFLSAEHLGKLRQSTPDRLLLERSLNLAANDDQLGEPTSQCAAVLLC
jgi:hypothetical protein